MYKKHLPKMIEDGIFQASQYENEFTQLRNMKSNLTQRKQLSKPYLKKANYKYEIYKHR